MTKQTRIEIRTTEKEKLEITQKAHCAGLSTSDFMRRIALNAKINSKHDLAVLIELRKMRADIARLGNLYRRSENNETQDEISIEIKQKLDSLRAYITRVVKPR